MTRLPIYLAVLLVASGFEPRRREGREEGTPRNLLGLETGVTAGSDGSSNLEDPKNRGARALAQAFREPVSSFASFAPSRLKEDASDAGSAAVEPVTVPAGWRPLAELAVDAPAGEAVRIESRSAYGDPANGCFALIQRVSAPASGFDSRRAAAAMLEALKAAGWTAGPLGDGGQLPFLRPGFQGRVRLLAEPLAGDRTVVVSVACFYNDREPDRCRPACDAMLDSAGVRR